MGRFQQLRKRGMLPPCFLQDFLEMDLGFRMIDFQGLFLTFQFAHPATQQRWVGSRSRRAEMQRGALLVKTKIGALLGVSEVPRFPALHGLALDSKTWKFSVQGISWQISHIPHFKRAIIRSHHSPAWAGAPVGGTIDWHNNISDPSDPRGFLVLPFLLERVNASVDKLEYLQVFTSRLEGIHACHEHKHENIKWTSLVHPWQAS